MNSGRENKMKGMVKSVYLFMILTGLTIAGQNISTITTSNYDDTPPPPKATMSTALQTLLHGHEPRIRPNAEGPPVQVNIGFYIESFHSISETDMEYSITAYFRQAWRDERLAHNSSNVITLDGDIKNIFWTPDTFFLNAKKETIHETPKANSLFSVSGDGSVFYSMRMTLTLSCHMDLTLFPFDEQECIIGIMSYAYRTSDIELSWLEGSDCPVTIQPKVELPGYTIPRSRCHMDLVQYISGNFSYLEVAFTLERRLGFYLLQAFVPSFGLVFISWLTLWIDPVSSPARATLAITTLLTLITLAQWVRNEIPKVAYVTAIDIWLVVCLGMVFTLIVEYAIVYYLYRLGITEKGVCHQEHKKVTKDISKDKKQESTHELDPSVFSVTQSSMTSRHCSTSNGTSPSNRKNNKPKTHKPKSYMLIGKRLDLYSRVGFLLIFAVFVVTYWNCYYSRKKTDVSN